MNEVFYVKNFSYKMPDTLNIESVPMMIRRRLSLIEKLAISSMLDCYENNNVNLIFASKYGEIERSLRLIKQYITDNAVSPTDFGFSVHNSSLSIFSILNKITNSYNSISAGENSFACALLDGVTLLPKADSLICYADTEEKNFSFSILISSNNSIGSTKITLTEKNFQSDNKLDFTAFFAGNLKFLDLGLFSIFKE